MKKGKSITLDPDVNEGTHREAKRQRLPFSTLVNKVLSEYLGLNKNRNKDGTKV